MSGIIGGIKGSMKKKNVAAAVSSGDSSWSSVSLLLTGETLLDSSPITKTATLYGSPVVSTTRAKYGNSSLYFDGVNSYMYYGQTPFTNLTSTSSLFTIEFWFNASQALTINSGVCIIGINSASAGSNILLYGKDIWISNATVRTGNTLAVDTWHHVAIVSNGTALTVFENGTSVYSGAVPTTALSSCVFALGGEFDGANGTSPGNYFGGYIDDFRITEGVARYTANFTPPTAALPTSAVGSRNVIFQLTGDGTSGSTTFTDVISNNNLTLTNTVTVNTSTKKYGTGSIYFSGNGNFLRTGANSNFALGTSDFTIEMWVYKVGTTGNDYNTMLSFGMYTDGLLFRDDNPSGGLYINGVGYSWPMRSYLTLNTWIHLALVRLNGALTLYVNGTNVWTGTNSTAINPAAQEIYVGASYHSPSAEGWNGYIDDIRISKSAVYTANFTPPTAALPVPVLGTQVFAASLHQATGPAAFNAGFAPDLVISGSRDGGSYQQYWYNRSSGIGNPPTGSTLPYITTTSTQAETNTGPYFYIGPNGFGVNVGWSTSDVIWMFKSTPGVMDVVTYTGAGTTGYRSITHTLGATPELIIVKNKSSATGGWVVGTSYVTNGFAGNNYLLNSSATTFGGGYLGGGGSYMPTTSTFFVEGYGNTHDTDKSGGNYIAYLFASLAGVSKVGSYTGNGSSQTINCNFTSSARFILIKRTDAAGDWYVWDTTRGITNGGNDPHISLNASSAEVTSDNSVDPNTTGFAVNQTAATNINVSSGSYIFLAIA